MTRWAMVADLERCVGCQTCTAACRHANATSPAVQWRKVLDIETGAYPNVSRIFVPVGCQHCADPPCLDVCPTTATRQRPDGIVTVDYDLCIGCAYCEVACPYQARFLVHDPSYAYGTAMQSEAERADDRRLGVAQKCTFCSDRIDYGLANALIPGHDPLATPACVNACIADALHFGDLDDPDSNVSHLLREHRSFRMHAELGTEPGFYYLYGKAEDTLPVADSGDSEPSRLRTLGAEPALQKHWDWKAAGNFIFGGFGSGLFIFAVAFGFAYAAIAPVGWAGLALVALGLFLVLLKIGRPLRAAFVLRHPQRSWMTREAWIAGMLFPVAAAALWSMNAILLAAAALLAAFFLYSQAMILRQAKGIPAWRARKIVPVIVVTGLTEGGGVLLAAMALVAAPRNLMEIAAVTAIMAATLRGWFWRAYLAELERTGAPERTLEALDRLRLWIFGLGLAFPLVIIIVALLSTAWAAPLFIVAGIAMAAAGVLLKFGLLRWAAFNQGFALPHTPARGGHAGAAVKPGWAAAIARRAEG